ncbi:MAG: TerB family tellurite resistance protein [Mucilaginibacter sp.]|nr:TerB family tellurite resistance protein [Mucilaginibacter sp.]
MRNLLRLLVSFLLPTALCYNPGRAGAQRQELQQLILDIEKLTQFKSILSDMKTGYQIYAQGYGTISNLSKGNFDLHHIYLGSLMAINPSIRNYGRIAEIISMQASLVSEYRNASSRFRQSGSFNISELSYMADVYARLLKESLDDLLELTNIITANKLRMSDTERIKAIDRLYATSSDKLQFLRSFNRQGVLLSIQRTKDAADNRTMKQLYGLTN